MTTRIRVAVFITTALVALAAIPTGAADAVLPTASPRIALGPDAAWSLRPSEAPAAGRRVVRVVYPSLFEPR